MAPHIMIIGGTGMLRVVALEFAHRNWTVSVIGRRLAALTDLSDEAEALPGRIIPLSADYTCSDSLAEKLRSRCDELGPPSLVVAWIHNTAPNAPIVVAREVIANSDHMPLDFVHVLSRLRTRDPRDRSVPIPCPCEIELRRFPTLTYRQAILGWIVEPSGSRWLTDDEIANGVIHAIDSGAAVTSIGQTEPIETNPEGIETR